MNRPARKPLRRTAWTMLLGGLAVTALMLGAGAFAIRMGEPAGLGQTATWPAGAEISVKPIGRQQDNVFRPTVVCTVTPQNSPPTKTWLFLGETSRPNFAGSATISCEQPVKVLTDPYLTVASVTREPRYFSLPLFVACLSVVFFFPRFVQQWGRSSLTTVVMRIMGTDRAGKSGPDDFVARAPRSPGGRGRR